MKNDPSALLREAALETARWNTRRLFFRQIGIGLGSMALGQFLSGCQPSARTSAQSPLQPQPPHHRARARSVIYLHMAGAPPQL